MPCRLSLHILVSIDSKKDSWPLEPCITFSKVKGEWLEPIAVDAAFLHIMVSFVHLASSLRGRNVRATTCEAIVHHQKAMILLRERLAGDDQVAKTSDLTVAVVLGLAMHAFVQGDYTTASHHMQGFGRMVDMRGGIVVFRNHAKLFTEMIKADLTIAVHSGYTPVLCTSQHELADCFSWPHFELLQSHSRTFSNVASSGLPKDLDMDSRLAEVWRLTKLFCGIVNDYAKTSHKLPDTVVLKVLGSVMYRLLHLKPLFEPGTDLIICEALIGFCSHVFLQQSPEKAVALKRGRDYRLSLRRFILARSEARAMAIWCIMTGLLSGLIELNLEWIKHLRSELPRLAITTWQGLRHHLKAHLWVDITHDRPTEAIYNRLISSHLT